MLFARAHRLHRDDTCGVDVPDGARVVHPAVGEDVTADALGGADVHQRNGVCQFVARDDLEAVAVARELLGYLESGRRPRGHLGPAGSYADPGEYVPRSAQQLVAPAADAFGEA
jgi:acetyl-CoA carboxylase carboxyltransferase component